MDEESQKAWDESRPSAVSSFILFLLLATISVAGAVYFGGELFASGRPQPAVVDNLCAVLGIIAGMCMTVSVYWQWWRFRAAPNRKFFREHPASALEQWTQIAGYLLLCAVFLLPSRLMGAESKPATANFLLAFPTGLCAVACIFGFFHERASRQTKSAV